MIPITRATLKSFCRVCLQELPLLTTTKDLIHDIKTDSFRDLVGSVVGVQIDVNQSCLPHSVCHSCFIKTNAFKSFRDKAIVATGVLNLLVTENLRETTLDELKLLCRVCLKKKNLVLDKESCSQIYDWMYQCTGLHLSDVENDSNIHDNFSNDPRYPPYVCIKCNGTLKNFMDFRAVARQTNEYLKNLLDEVVEEKYECKQEGSIVEDNHSNESQYIAEHVLCNISTKSDSDCDELTLDYEVPTTIDESTGTFLNADDKTESYLEEDALWKLEEDNCDRKVTRNYKLQKMKLLETEKDLKLESADVATEKNSHRFSRKEIQINSEVKSKKVKKTLKCLECKKRFYKKYMYDAHMKVHEGINKPFECPYCPSSFKIVQVLNRHISVRHNAIQLNSNDKTNENKSMHPCLYCQKPFKRKDHLNEHIRSVHKRLRPFKCRICDKSFAAKNSRIRHEQNHSQERPFSCEFCSKRYNSESELKVHVQRHITNPELLCPICKRGKPNEEELKKHIAMHEASRQHQCPKCGKVFTKLFHLREHDNTVHLKLRPFKCSRCDQTFGVRKTLKTHEQSHFSTGRPELCNICQLFFKSKRALLLHTNKVHAT